MLTNVFNVNVMFYTDSGEPGKLKYALSLEDKTDIPKDLQDGIKHTIQEVLNELILKAEDNF